MLFIILFAAIALLVIIHVFFQDRFIFQVERLDKSHSYNFSQSFEEHFIEVEPGVHINALWFKPETNTKGLVFYFHGNAGNLDRWGDVAADFTELGYELLIIDYRGYGKSEGEPSEKALYHDAEVVWTWAKERSVIDRKIIYGRSLGSSVAAYLASIVQPELLILETPFDELRGVVSGILYPVIAVFPLKYRFPTKDHLKNVQSKIVIFHGTDDHVVPLKSALKLKELLDVEDEFIIIEEARHDNIRNYQLYSEKLRELLN